MKFATQISPLLNYLDDSAVGDPLLLVALGSTSLREFPKIGTIAFSAVLRCAFSAAHESAFSAVMVEAQSGSSSPACHIFLCL